jgi:hypothetical protein
MKFPSIIKLCVYSVFWLTACNSPYKEVISFQQPGGTLEKVLLSDVKDTMELQKYILNNLPKNRSVFYYFFDTSNDLSTLKADSISETICDSKSKIHIYKCYIVFDGKIISQWHCQKEEDSEKVGQRKFSSSVFGSSF